MSTLKISKTDLTAVRNLLMGSPFNCEERTINYGVQYTCESGIKCNIHYSDKSPEILKATIQNGEKNLEQKQLLEFHLSSFALSNA
ncbi:hypothetical protein ACPV5H_26010 [Vibrio harveyi]|uniref:hypothetical protein n=1 Tax=Vibrionaceae TaxID=641 RepID=UPI00039BF931|nr:MULTISPECIES: hypothetical protein [Vibrio harveyi group]EHK9578207.1 hypothetical protein [Vibrio parahaemolyticus]EHK9582955.1 hypothetical protein [Vibrio parahaemolyticus]EIZ1900284.1 hypothetical protein [Vibrio parahaemolyticus]PIB14637.1 hypothetical protein B853_15769 [Vibrio rotiferianus CAIM 577 = LMG 21460]